MIVIIIITLLLLISLYYFFKQACQLYIACQLVRCITVTFKLLLNEMKFYKITSIIITIISIIS